MKKVALWMTVAILLTSCGVQVGGHVDNVPVVKHDVKVYSTGTVGGALHLSIVHTVWLRTRALDAIGYTFPTV